MKFRVTFLDGVDLLIEAEKEVDAVKRAKELKSEISDSGSNSVLSDSVPISERNVGEAINRLKKVLEFLPKSPEAAQVLIRDVVKILTPFISDSIDKDE